MNDKFEQISISDMINILIKRKKLIALTIVGFLILGLLSSFIFTKQKYLSEIVLEINNIESPVVQAPVGKSSAVYNVLESITHAGDMDFNAYIKELTSDEVIKNTIKELKLEDKYTLGTLKSDLSISADPEIKNIDLRFVSKDPEQGATILNVLSSNFSDHITDISRKNSLQTLDIIEKQMKIEKEKYAESLKEYKGAMKGNSSALELELEIEGVYGQLTAYKLGLNDLEIKREGVLAALEKSNSSPGDSGNMILRPGEKDAFIYLDSSKKVLELDLAETEARLKSTQETIDRLKENVKTLEIDYQDVEFAESVIRQKVDLTKQSYEVFAQKYQELNMTSSIDVGGISINTISGTPTSGSPVGTRKVIKLAVFLVLGVMTGIILAFLKEYIDMIKTKKGNIK